MRYLQVTATPPPERAPPFFGLIADSEPVEEARLVDWNLGGDDVTLLYTVDGDPASFEDTVGESDLVAATGVEVAPIGDGQFYVLATLDPGGSPLFDRLTDTFGRTGLVVVKPIVYRDGRVHARIVGATDVLQATMETVPPIVDVTIHEIGSFPGSANAPTATLSDRQREAVLAALDLGYYDVPSEMTHEDVADRLGCAPSTASEHLRKAEAKLVRAAMASDPDAT